MKRIALPLIALGLAVVASATMLDQEDGPEGGVPEQDVSVREVDLNAQARDAGDRPGSCLAEIGRPAAEALVQKCLNVSPATRPPCNMANSCSLIESEIARGCDLIGEDGTPRPDYCPPE